MRDQQPDIYLTTVAYPLRGTARCSMVKSQVKYQNGWETHLQRELDIRGRFTAPLYQCAIKKLASEYRQRQLDSSPQDLPKRVYHALRSVYGFPDSPVGAPQNVINVIIRGLAHPTECHSCAYAGILQKPSFMLLINNSL
ncbi:MAG: hypothetical protein R3C26_22570 [Calditrichia bacterium]